MILTKFEMFKINMNLIIYTTLWNKRIFLDIKIFYDFCEKIQILRFISTMVTVSNKYIKQQLYGFDNEIACIFPIRSFILSSKFNPM